MKIARELRAMYSTSEIKNALGISIGSLYYEPKAAPDESWLERDIKAIFESNYSCYGRRRIKRVLQSMHPGIIISERKISQIMSRLGLISSYVKGHPKKPKADKKVNNSADANLLQRQFNDYDEYEVVLCDLTYIKINKWYYLCVLLDLCRRVVLGYSIGKEKGADLVKQALYSCKIDLRKIYIFHTDRGSEFTGQAISVLLLAMEILHSLSAKGEPCDNAPMEAFYKSLKTEFVKNRRFSSVEQLKSELSDWMYWYNHIRLHSSLDYQPPVLPLLEVINDTQ